MGVHIGFSLEYQYRQSRTRQQKRRQLTDRTQADHGNVECHDSPRQPVKRMSPARERLTSPSEFMTASNWTHKVRCRPHLS